MNDSTHWIRTRQSRALIGAALAMSLALGAAFVAVNDPPPDAPAQHGAALSDAQAAAQVVDAAREIVATAGLREATGGYTFMSCSTGDEPPYQAALYMSFAVPQATSAQYLDGVASAMAADGWAVSAVVGEHFGHKLTLGGVISDISRNPEKPGFATMRLYGECRNIADHRDDNPAWTDVSL
ncbi:hypothetical protein [Mycobacterium deserti]|uniref:Lipoprotein LppJ n=1 Tax=Mycobacterium deserti TaxID=2978347 RepID=A0ABT2MLF5_9MYCO|nr:hypothetical protein [Mycobacterium deserti]MCT7661890.1 hypothetical protein [Mycobacterium deserti]